METAQKASSPPAQLPGRAQDPSLLDRVGELCPANGPNAWQGLVIFITSNLCGLTGAATASSGVVPPSTASEGLEVDGVRLVPARLWGDSQPQQSASPSPCRAHI